MFNRETVRQQYIKNLPFIWHNSHSKLIFVASKSPQYKQGLQEKQVRIHSPTRENRKSKCFCTKRNHTNPLLASNFQHPRNSPCSYASRHYSTIQQDARTEGSPNWTGQMGKAFIWFPEKLFSWHAWKKTKTYTTLFNFFPSESLCLAERDRVQQQVSKSGRSEHSVTAGKEGSGHWVWVKNLHSATFSIWTLPQSWKYHQTHLQNCCEWRIQDKQRP